MRSVPKPSNLVRPQAIIFDWDSTLVDNWGTIRSALNATLVNFGHKPWTMMQVRKNAKGSARDTFPNIFGVYWKQALELFYQNFQDLHLKKIQPLPDAEALLEIIFKHNTPVSIVSNKTGDFLRAEVSHLGWEKFFHKTIGASDATYDKPSVHPVHLALSETGILVNENIWFIGDSIIDLKCAHTAGCLPLLISGGDITQRELLMWPPKYTFSSCLAVKQMFLACQKN